MFSFVLHNVSRVVTHELVRHRPGTAVSQESLRFVRLTDIPFWFPDWAAGRSRADEAGDGAARPDGGVPALDGRSFRA